MMIPATGIRALFALALLATVAETRVPECNETPVMFSKCMEGFLELWEHLRLVEVQASDLLYPVPFYSRSSLLRLCDGYHSAKEQCFPGPNRCENVPLVSFVRNHLDYFCGVYAPIYLEERNFYCSLRTVQRYRRCKRFIVGIPNPTESNTTRKCVGIPQFFGCIEKPLLHACGNKAAALLKMSIADFGCSDEEDNSDAAQLLANFNSTGALTSATTKAYLREQLRIIHIRPLVLPDFNLEPELADIPVANSTDVLSEATNFTNITSQLGGTVENGAPLTTRPAGGVERTMEMNNAAVSRNQEPEKIFLRDKGKLIESAFQEDTQGERVEVSRPDMVALVPELRGQPTIGKAVIPAWAATAKDAIQGSTTTGIDMIVTTTNDHLENGPTSSTSTEAVVKKKKGSSKKLKDRKKPVHDFVRTVPGFRVVRPTTTTSKTEETEKPTPPPFISSSPETTPTTSTTTATATTSETVEEDGIVTTTEKEETTTVSVETTPEVVVPVEVPVVKVEAPVIPGSSLEKVNVSPPESEVDTEATMRVAVDTREDGNRNKEETTEPSESSPSILAKTEEPEEELMPVKVAERVVPTEAVKTVKKSECKEQDSKKISRCYQGVLNELSSLASQSPSSSFIRFPLFNFTSTSVLSLCSKYITALDCIGPQRIKSCGADIQLHTFLGQQFSAVCGAIYRGDFRKVYACLQTNLQSSGCLHHINGTVSEDRKCEGHTRLLSCLDGSITEKCSVEGEKLMRRMINGFGCSIKEVFVEEEVLAKITSMEAESRARRPQPETRAKTSQSLSDSRNFLQRDPESRPRIDLSADVAPAGLEDVATTTETTPKSEVNKEATAVSEQPSETSKEIDLTTTEELSSSSTSVPAVDVDAVTVTEEPIQSRGSTSISTQDTVPESTPPSETTTSNTPTTRRRETPPPSIYEILKKLPQRLPMAHDLHHRRQRPQPKPEFLESLDDANRSEKAKFMAEDDNRIDDILSHLDHVQEGSGEAAVDQTTTPSLALKKAVNVDDPSLETLLFGETASSSTADGLVELVTTTPSAQELSSEVVLASSNAAEENPTTTESGSERSSERHDPGSTQEAEEVSVPAPFGSNSELPSPADSNFRQNLKNEVAEYREEKREPDVTEASEALENMTTPIESIDRTEGSESSTKDSFRGEALKVRGAATFTSSIDPPQSKDGELVMNTQSKEDLEKLEDSKVPDLSLPSRTKPKTAIASTTKSNAASQSRVCIAPLMRTWIALRENRPELSSGSFPLYKYTRVELLELCDGYANSFLCAGFEKIRSCLSDELVRFAQDHLGYICSPPYIVRFMKHYDCIMEQEVSARGGCRKYVQGIAVPGKDQNKCLGVPAYRACLAPLIHRKCSSAALAEFDQSIRQFGCAVVV